MLKHKYSGLVFSFLILPFAIFAKDNSQGMEHYLQALVDSASIPGLSFGYIEKGSPVQLFAVGLADTTDNVAVSEDTIFEAASLSKPVLAFIVLKLAERGEFSLDQPLYKTLENTRIENKEWAKLITPRHVLAHQTGLPNWGDQNLEISFKPGSDFNYSGEGYVYLQKAVEKITGLSLQALAEKEVFKPLGMENSYFTWNKEDQLKIAQGHDRAGNQVTRDIPESNAASSLHTTPEDYLKFVKAWFNTEQLHQDFRQTAFKSISTKNQGEPTTTMGWGLGWGVFSADQSKSIWHWGDNGVFRALVVIQPDTERAFVYFANSQNGLAITKQLTEKIFPGSHGISHWLGYGQSDSPLWQAERKGYEMESQGMYLEAQQFFEEVLKEFPDNQRLKNKINWLNPLVSPPENALTLNPDMLEKLVGHYGERQLFLDDGVLKYQRNQGTAFALIPFYDNVFKVGDFSEFRLEVLFDDKGDATKLVGHYENGFSDESERTGD